MSKQRSKRVAKRAKAKPARGRKMSARTALTTATSAAKSVRERVAAMANVTQVVCGDDKKLQAMLKVLRDTNEPTPVRLAALQALQAASFAVVEFESCRGDYVATLRTVAKDPDPELRQRVLGLLAREKDGFAQRLLLEGLQDPEKAIVPPEKALQLLSYDVHAEAYPIARMIVNKPPTEAAKREALRLLAADASSKPLFERILLDKAETKEIRQIAASVLQSIAPEALQTHAREMLLDPKEYDDIQATSLTALTQFGNAAEIGQDKKLMSLVSSLKSAASSKLKQGARHFLTKYSA
jgi:HEAT repeat protein